MLSPRWWRRAGGWERAHRLIGGQGPSTFVEADAGSVRRLLAKDRMAAAAKRAVHLEVQAMVAALRKFGGLAAALCFAKSLMKVVDSRLQRPPISSHRTTRRERPCPNSSG